MAMPERDTVYTSEREPRAVYTRESSATGWFVGIVVALALLAIGYLIFAANSTPTTSTVDVNNTPVIEAPVTEPMAPTTGTETTPMAPATEAPVVEAPAPVETAPAPADAAPATEAPAPVETAPVQ